MTRLIVLVALMVLVALTGCDDKRNYVTECEKERLSLAVNRFDERLNESDFDAIYDDYLELESGPLFSRSDTERSLKYLKETYGNVLDRHRSSVSVQPSERQCESVVVATDEVTAERGRYVMLQNWHTMDTGSKLAYFTLMEYDENGKLYLKLRLRHGLGEDDVRETKIKVQ